MSRCPYGTHLPILTHILLNHTINNVIEFGPGHNSTPIFIKKCKKVQSIEMQNIAWYREIKEKYSANQNFSIDCSLSATGFYELEYIENPDLVFVDGHADSRPEVINFFKGKAPIIVTHDTNTPVLRWERLDIGETDGYKRFDYKKLDPYTTVFSTNYQLIKSLTNVI